MEPEIGTRPMTDLTSVDLPTPFLPSNAIISPLAKLKPFAKYAKKNIKLRNAEKWSKECLSLPIHPMIKSKEVIFIANEIKRFFLKK